MDRILVPVDFSAPSVRAVDYAVNLAEASRAMLHLVHVVEPAPFLTGLDSIPLALSNAEAAAQCEHELAKLAKEYSSPDAPISSDVRIGKPAHEVCNIAKQSNSDLIVLSTHGRTGLKHLLMGSVAEKIVREATCPVLMLRDREANGDRPPGYASSRIRKVLVPTDFSPMSIEALRYATRFANLVRAEITLVHCVMPPVAFTTPQAVAIDLGAITESLRHAAQQTIADIAHEHLPPAVDGGFDVVVGPPLAEIPEFATVGKFDLIICATHGYTGLKRALLGSTAEALVRYSPCPVLVFRGKPRRIIKHNSISRTARV
jgi:nucleotide-binding universal stress UspA family protein